jgi:hypothetical protein
VVLGQKVLLVQVEALHAKIFPNDRDMAPPRPGLVILRRHGVGHDQKALVVPDVFHDAVRDISESDEVGPG